MKAPVTIDRFEKNGAFVCPVCGKRISPIGKTTTAYVVLVGAHYATCTKSISRERLSEILDFKG
jgi:uncharacterized Zn finger protein (UPF0148 family)